MRPIGPVHDSADACRRHGVPVEYAVLCEGFDRLADDAEDAGVRIAFENTPFTHHVKTTQDAVAFVAEVGNPNGGLLLDIWHAYRGGTAYATLPARVAAGNRLRRGA